MGLAKYVIWLDPSQELDILDYSGVGNKKKKAHKTEEW